MALYKGTDLIAGQGVSDASIQRMQEQINALLYTLGVDTSDFSSSSTYAVGDIVSYQYYLWKCHTAVTSAGAWTGTTNWQKIQLIQST